MAKWVQQNGPQLQQQQQLAASQQESLPRPRWALPYWYVSLVKHCSWSDTGKYRLSDHFCLAAGPPPGHLACRVLHFLYPRLSPPTHLACGLQRCPPCVQCGQQPLALPQLTQHPGPAGSGRWGANSGPHSALNPNCSNNLYMCGLIGVLGSLVKAHKKQPIQNPSSQQAGNRQHGWLSGTLPCAQH
jgi:hypothetical protein